MFHYSRAGQGECIHQGEAHIFIVFGFMSKAVSILLNTIIYPSGKKRGGDLMKYKRRIFVLSVMDMILLLISSLCSLIISNDSLRIEYLSLNTVLSIIGFIVINS